MARFDRYMLSQLVVMFGFFSLVLVLVYWINRAVVLFDSLIADGQSAAVFLEFTALSLPSVIRIALPLAAFAAAVYVTNRMSTESELVVVQATGFSPYRLARPVLYFGVIVFALMTLLMHILVPLASARLDARTAEIAQNITSRFLTPGEFLEPTDGLTFYIGDVTPAGELKDVFLADLRNIDRQVTYTAASAYLVRSDESTQLVMVDGMAQILEPDGQRLSTTSFKDFAYDIGGFITVTTREGRRDAEVPTLELLRATDALVAETGKTRAELIARAHDRISQSILGSVAALLGFAALIVGGFSRFGVWRQIVIAIFLIIVIKAVETAGLNAARDDPSLWFAAYGASAVGLLFVAALLYMSAHPSLFKRRIPA
ncbi:lipopolysaccharide export system permease protein [Loktanella ponticola]|uniref:Lipopolysaccharide export system permease protein n=1 Tax=Yoonia ponticola TaxID=1524255 RepID=A0A7W9BK54_9RHOB|nr:lipopolysaccharide export system permease protein [Yoonia ponticola]